MAVRLSALRAGRAARRNLHRTTQTQNISRLKAMPREGFKPTIPIFERVKPFHASDRAATVIGEPLKAENI
jgi:hypothetical protein